MLAISALAATTTASSTTAGRQKAEPDMCIDIYDTKGSASS